jgi:hypothetical protein
MSSAKRIKELVYSGMVLDEHGEWISLSEKLLKEKKFLYHLEQGEVLQNGTWVKISDLRQSNNQKEKSSMQISVGSEESVNEETTIAPISIVTPEETVSFSTETLHDHPIEPSRDDTSIDYPPETKFLKIHSPEDKKHNTSNLKDKTTHDELLATGETQLDIQTLKPPEKSTVQKQTGIETEFEETVMYNINILKQNLNTPSTNQTRVHQTPKKHSPRFMKTIASDDWEFTRPKNHSFIYVIAIIIIVAIFITIKSLL